MPASTVYCKAPGCGQDSKRFPNLGFFKFPPKDPIRLPVWKAFCGITDEPLDPNAPPKKPDRLYLCIDHFPPEYIGRPSNGRAYLVRNAVPKIHAADLKQMRQEREKVLHNQGPSKRPSAKKSLTKSKKFKSKFFVKEEPSVSDEQFEEVRPRNAKDVETFNETFRIPVTLRGYFWRDSFFRNGFENFAMLRKALTKDYIVFSGKSRRVKPTEAEAEEAAEHAPKRSSRKFVIKHQDPQFFPRPWLMPDLFDDNGWRYHDLYQHDDDRVIRLTNDPDMFELWLDAHGYRFNDLKLYFDYERVLSIEGNHLRTNDDGYTFDLGHFIRKYNVKTNATYKDFSADLSCDGILVISTPVGDDDEEEVTGQEEPILPTVSEPMVLMNHE